MHPRYNAQDLFDMFGQPIEVGQTILRAVILKEKSPAIHLGKVTKIDKGRAYIDNSQCPIRFPGRMIILSKE